MPITYTGDTYGRVLVGPTGFGASWADYIYTGTPNAMLSEGQLGVLPAGRVYDDPAGLTNALPHWIVSSINGAVGTLTADATYPSGQRIRCTFPLSGGILSVGSDLLVLSAGQTVSAKLLVALTVAGGDNLGIQYETYFYDVNGVFITDGGLQQQAYAASVSLQWKIAGVLGTATPPMNARYVRHIVGIIGGTNVASVGDIGAVICRSALP